jgi:hypothetical protein
VVSEGNYARRFYKGDAIVDSDYIKPFEMERDKRSVTMVVVGMKYHAVLRRKLAVGVSCSNLSPLLRYKSIRRATER